ncbi:MAG: prolipoprotein diacylglyceryl transferase [Verrucomicrobiota bacterium]|jgi:phosphatidylglycerol:prolipoprotein diacylglycerol transferase|nr:prolipoprotein diacylglyceryl transferase [Verrucomicrobiota bacterium]
MDSIAFKIGVLEIHWYGILVACGFLVGLWTASRRSVFDGLDGKVVSDLGVWIIIGALVGARALYVVTEWGEYSDKPFSEWVNFRSGGLVFYGGFIGGAIAVILYIVIQGRQPLWKIADALAPSIPLGHALGRLGCLMTGCCFGTACDLPWAIQFPANSLAFDALGQAPADAAHSVSVHPSQVYSALLNFALYGGLAWVYRRKQFDGQLFALYLIVYSINRFIVEFFRGDYQFEQMWFGWIKPGQQLSMMLLPLGLVLLVFLWRRSILVKEV